MCGFAIIVSGDESVASPAIVRKMTSVIRHRGPDDHGLQQVDNVTMGFRRLSIIDLSDASHQPMWDRDKSCLIVFNGEIYNYLEIRRKLEKLGHRFMSSGDTEVLLASYLQWGTACLEYLNGMFSFAIYDRRTKCLFGARDRLGIKPLHLYRNRDAIILASEIKSIIATGQVPRVINWRVASRYLLTGRLDINDETFYEGITKIPSGHKFEIDTHALSVNISPYWKLVKRDIDTGELAEKYYEVFQDSIRLRLRSDVPVGVFLSGGLDSTSIICEMSRQLGCRNPDNPLHAFSFISGQHDESEYINETLKWTGACAHRITDEPGDIWETLDRALIFHDEPVHSMTALVGFRLMRMARDHGVKVILNGQGADEVLAGYASYFMNYWYGLARSMRMVKLREEIDAYVRKHGGDVTKLMYAVLRKTLRTLLRSSVLYRRLSLGQHLKRIRSDPWYTMELKDKYELADAYDHDETLSDALHFSITRYPLPLYLRIEDRNSMANSVEARLPFMDYRLVELGYSAPDERKLSGPWNKQLLRTAMVRSIPEKVRCRPDKMGFPTPADDWMRHDRNSVMAMLYKYVEQDTDIYNVNYIKAMANAHMNGQANHASRLFRIIQFGMWRDNSNL